ncbi:hypothetical protein CPB84DRAFT_1245528 [Gymnopilus junonius]|uniref:Uncharacterized protein n=1 Tax=Gymnopilus junonius TaxID=109634 RepID=A0A9P5NMB1_GYMJU|nr:hypothetical protein CPB84DRAFT_1245528 [Gymnopilus junonius]
MDVHPPRLSLFQAAWGKKIRRSTPPPSRISASFKSLLLTIRLGMTRRNALFAHEQYRSLYKLLIQECYRWKDIEVFDCASLVVEYMQETPLSLPLLQSASFGTSRTPIVHPRLDVIFVQNAPQLRSLSLTSMKLPEGGLPYYHLTHFTASNLFRSDLLDILRRAPNLRSCVLVETGGSLTNTVNPPLPKVVLKHLEFLTARNCPGLEELFEGIASVPALRDFRCTAGTAQHPSLGSIKNLLHRSQCKLETLQIGTVCVCNEGLLRS